jgi:hypothetical protein
VGALAQVVEHLLSKCKAQIPVLPKKEKEKADVFCFVFFSDEQMEHGHV